MPSQPSSFMRPFSHVPGETCLLPSSSWVVQAYPTLVSLEHLNAAHEKILFALEVTGPVKGFTLMQDLERDFVRMYGTAKEGYFSLRLTAGADAVTLMLERCPEEGVSFSFQGRKKRLKRKETFAFPLPHEVVVYPHEQIHLGSHKKQDWTLVKRRLNLEEILPLWFALGCKCPKELLHFEGVAELLKACKTAIKKQDRLQIGPLFLQLFQAGFHGMLTPRLADTDFQGIVPCSGHSNGSPLVLLSYGAELIRKLFLDTKGEELLVLPCLPVELHAGRCRGFAVSDALTVDIEWSKKIIRRLTLRSHADQTLKLGLQKDLKSFRLEKKRVQKETELNLEAGKTYVLDRFEK